MTARGSACTCAVLRRQGPVLRRCSHLRLHLRAGGQAPPASLHAKLCSSPAERHSTGWPALQENYFLDDGAYGALKIVIEQVRRRLEGQGDISELLAELRWVGGGRGGEGKGRALCARKLGLALGGPSTARARPS